MIEIEVEFEGPRSAGVDALLLRTAREFGVTLKEATIKRRWRSVRVHFVAVGEQDAVDAFLLKFAEELPT